MKRYSFFAPLWMSWTPGDLYRDLARHGRGAGVLWLLFLTVASTGIRTLKLASTVDEFRTNLWPAIVKQIPDIKVVNGVFSTPDNQPVEIHNPTDKAIMAVLLPAESSVPAKYSDVTVVVVSDRIVFRNSNGESRDMPFDKQKDFAFTNAELVASSDRLFSLAPWLAAPFILAGWFVVRLIYWLILSITAVAASGAAGGKFSYGALLRITAAAETPTIVLDMILLALGMAVPFKSSLFFVVTVVLIVLAIRAAARTDEPPQFESDRSATPPPAGT